LNVFKTTTSKGGETRQRIYDAALALFREKGFEAATMRDIATAAGMSLGAAYHYFPSKDAIVLAYYEDVTSEHERRVADQLRSARALRDRLRIPFHSKLDILQGDRPLMGALFRFAGQPTHPLSFLGPETRPMQRRNMAVFAQPLQGVSMPDDMRMLAPVLLWSMHMGMLLFFLYDASAEQRRTRRLVDGAVDLFIIGLRIAKLPLIGVFRRKVLAILSEASLVPDLPSPDALNAAPGTSSISEER
jgi:AcrR family transcriptional regulator